jgi:hypothetical protein
MTSKWVRQVAAQRDYTVDWRFISLRMLNAEVDYDSHFPAGYEAGHTAGLRLLRVAARTRAEHGRRAVGPLNEAIGTRRSTPLARPRWDRKNGKPRVRRGCSSRPACPPPTCTPSASHGSTVRPTSSRSGLKSR